MARLAAQRGAFLYAGVACLLLVLFLATLPQANYGDDLFYVWILVSGRGFANHPLYVPVTRLLATTLAAWAGVDPLSSLRCASAAAAAIAVPLLFAVLQRHRVRATTAAA